MEGLVCTLGISDVELSHDKLRTDADNTESVGVSVEVGFRDILVISIYP